MGRFFIYILTGIILICSCNNKERKQTDENTISNSITTLHTDSVQSTDTLAKVQIEDPHFNFGEIQKGEIVTHTFKIKNTGTKNLLITHTESSCGCTIPKYDKKPIPPGGEGKIEVEFNSSGRMGKQYKVIHIFANIPEKSFTLKITANIKN
ncbi:DUF1573 domain-containing protein [Gabonibacter chumensis]|uniref:DUF1573 domain-containing protein n=1 Tax=Gabonibacter chumensis TaxID=2972474 RepID=UPI002573C9E7|nr:DUF1573 domain-containing protein [Gabonibacter chumensis]MCR9011732.1 DUF1573 domain-containing protein [Gabonibacter chumensis]